MRNLNRSQIYSAAHLRIDKGIFDAGADGDHMGVEVDEPGRVDVIEGLVDELLSRVRSFLFEILGLFA